MIWDYQKILARRLLLWGVLSTLAGVLLYTDTDPLWCGIGLQAAAWGLTDAVIAVFGLIGSARKLSKPQSQQQAEKDTRSLHKILWINTGLDVLYISGGIVLLLYAGEGNPFMAGNGWGVIVQGGFLLVFDLLHAQAVPRPILMVDLGIFDDPRHDTFHLPGGQPAAVVVHGFPGTPEEVRSLGEVINQAGWTVQGLLLPGFGKQITTLFERHEEEWVAAIAQAVGDLRQQGHAPVALVGFSLGGALAVMATGREKPDKLVLLAPFWFVEPWWVTALIDFTRTLLPVSLTPMRRANLNNPRLRQVVGSLVPEFDLDDPTNQRYIRAFRFPLSLLETVRRVGNNSVRKAKNLTIPVLLVQGRQDDVMRPWVTRRMLARLGGPLRYVELDAPHNLGQDGYPAFRQVAGEIISFLK